MPASGPAQSFATMAKRPACLGTQDGHHPCKEHCWILSLSVIGTGLALANLSASCPAPRHTLGSLILCGWPRGLDFSSTYSPTQIDTSARWASISMREPCQLLYWDERIEFMSSRQPQGCYEWATLTNTLHLVPNCSLAHPSGDLADYSFGHHEQIAHQSRCLARGVVRPIGEVSFLCERDMVERMIGGISHVRGKQQE